MISKLETCPQKALNLEREVKEIKSMLYKTKYREIAHTFMKSFMLFLNLEDLEEPLMLLKWGTIKLLNN